MPRACKHFPASSSSIDDPDRSVPFADAPGGRAAGSDEPDDDRKGRRDGAAPTAGTRRPNLHVVRVDQARDRLSEPPWYRIRLHEVPNVPIVIVSASVDGLHGCSCCSCCSVLWWAFRRFNG
jgi:hypothetical protein